MTERDHLEFESSLELVGIIHLLLHLVAVERVTSKKSKFHLDLTLSHSQYFVEPQYTSNITWSENLLILIILITKLFPVPDYR